MLQQKANYEAVRDGFSWDIPEHFNIGVAICDRWAEKDPDRLALIDVSDDGTAQEVRFGRLRDRSNQLANGLRALGVGPGDRVAILLPQCVETALGHIAVHKLGAISLPLFTLFGPDAIAHRLADSGAKVVITHARGAEIVEGVREELPNLQHVISIDGAGDNVTSFDNTSATQSVDFEPFITRSDDPALLIYTSGTTGNPKGALHAHRVLLGHLPGVEMSHNFLPQRGDVLWTPADWAWIGGLLDVLMPGLYHGVPVVAQRFSKFSAEAAVALIRAHEITCAFLPPTALKLMRMAGGSENWALGMRSVASGGEPLGAELLEWGRKAFGCEINEFYGQTECNMVVSACGALESAVPGHMGWAVPGHAVAVIDEATGVRVAQGHEGAIAVLVPDPVMFLEYWRNAKATDEKFLEGPEGRWLLTGDRGSQAVDGRFRFLGRDDDVISSAGYRIGPGEVEDCLLRHPAVQLAGVVGLPDDLRGEIVAGFILLVPGVEGDEVLAEEIAQFVKTQLAAHEYPRVIRFVTEMPMTTTGKIIRAKLREMGA